MGRVLFVVALIGSSLCAQTTAPSTSPSIESLLIDLAADEFATRRRAAEQIAAMGKDAIPQLEEHLKQSANEEVRTALETAIAKIRESDVSGPTLITATFTAATAQRVFEELSRQSGIEIKVTGNDGWDRLVETRDLSFSRKPFWQAMVEACDAFGFGFSMPAKSIQLHPGGSVSKFRATAGPFLFVADSITRSTSTSRNLGDPQRPVDFNSSLNIQVRVHGEPKVSTQTMELTIDEARDELNNDLRQATNEVMRGRMLNFGSRGEMRLLPIRLAIPEKPGANIAKLSGKATLHIIAKSSVVEIGDVLNAEPQEHAIPGGVLRTEKLQRNGPMLTMRVTGEVRDVWNASMLQDVRLVDAHGRAFRNAGRGSTSNGNKIEFDLRFVQMPEINVNANLGDGRFQRGAHFLVGALLQMLFKLRNRILPHRCDLLGRAAPRGELVGGEVDEQRFD